ncbi:uncharacterized protein LOC110099032 [Dendrobium catenatum]|uniref:Uncharacterized protein n=1 Tax=Dendrobium catenatum TaxID=906689 RepID=A0A2I0VKV9_9ASPA|nr:uncharacterized protein LOC110099032 [Dendrobium catenatum]PKU64003.1 hypothetical protein MA16_Dca012589 [Dendrobium catenatum]
MQALDHHFDSLLRKQSIYKQREGLTKLSKKREEDDEIDESSTRRLISVLAEMGCGSSKTLIKSVSTREEFHTPLQKKTSGHEETLVSKNGTEHQFITILCTSNSPAKQLYEEESSKQSSPTCNNASPTKSFNLMAPIIEAGESENNIEIINSWELLAGLEDDDEVEEQRKTDCSMSLNSIKQSSESSKDGGEGEKGLKRKMMATELVALKVPAFEFARTGSLRDWLMQGGQVMPNGSHVTPKFGSFEHPTAGGTSESFEENVFDPALVAQLEQAMEDLTVEEEQILNQIVEKWEGSVMSSESWK